MVKVEEKNNPFPKFRLPLSLLKFIYALHANTRRDAAIAPRDNQEKLITVLLTIYFIPNLSEYYHLISVLPA